MEEELLFFNKIPPFDFFFPFQYPRWEKFFFDSATFTWAMMIRYALTALLLFSLSPSFAQEDPVFDVEEDPVFDEDFALPEKDANDTIEGFNRAIFTFNQALDTSVLRPFAILYLSLPESLRLGVGNFLQNLQEPVYIINATLQGDGPGVRDSTVRFVINSLTSLGFIDFAKAGGLPRKKRDFGQTLALWGKAEGPYLVLPFLGPSNVRDSLGLVVDTAASPWTYFWSKKRQFSVLIIKSLDARARFLPVEKEFSQGSIDYYARIRSLSRQNRRAFLERSVLKQSPLDSESE